MLLHGQSVGHRLPFVFTFEISCSCANAWFPPMFNTIFGCFTVYSILMLLFASVVPSPQWSVSSWLSFGIYTLIAFPRSTNQWSFLGLNFWPNQSVEKPSNEFDLIGNPISKVLDFFPTPVQEECLSQDKRRQGVCMNTYECRIQRGKSLGRCALGFGVCCICK
ncbi:uncharacterized protein LOC105735728 [Apis florea]|uniref:uncharacterized protein LOC105735728 n=1 Tax=Apis florea TaxID=7463 RepID=UPI0006296C87|nr:uncharacterized protein LOC105735728 [Apis florea]